MIKKQNRLIDDMWEVLMVWMDDKTSYNILQAKVRLDFNPE
jgi:hypothetical protein